MVLVLRPQPISHFPHLPLLIAKANNNNKDEAENKFATRPIQDFHVTESQNHILLSMDLPGVKIQDVLVSENKYELKIEATRKFDGDKAIKYQRTFLLDKKTVNPASTNAYLSDGVLTIEIPRKATTSPISVATLSAEAPEEEEGKCFRSQLEIPGVKAPDLKITVRGDTLLLEAKRKVGASTSLMKRSFVLDEDDIECSKLQAYLSDGILTLVAPKKVAVAAAADDEQPRTFEVKHGMPMKSKGEIKAEDDNNDTKQENNDGNDSRKEHHINGEWETVVETVEE